MQQFLMIGYPSPWPSNKATYISPPRDMTCFADIKKPNNNSRFRLMLFLPGTCGKLKIMRSNRCDFKTSYSESLRQSIPKSTRPFFSSSWIIVRAVGILLSRLERSSRQLDVRVIFPKWPDIALENEKSPSPSKRFKWNHQWRFDSKSHMYQWNLP